MCNTTDYKTLPPLMTVKQTAELAQCSVKHVRRMLSDGKLTGCRVGKLWRVNRDSLLEHLGLA